MAAPQPRRPLEVVAAEQYPPVPADHRAQAVIECYSAEHQLVGSLMWLTGPAGRSLLELVPVTAISRPLARWAYELIGRIIAEGAAPTPPAVLAAAGRHPAAGALDPAQRVTATELHRLALYLFEAYQQAVAPHAGAATYAREVLEQAYRSAFESCGTRMRELAAGGAARAELAAELTAITAELGELWWRAEAAATRAGRAH